jgi:D-beta-D-heptose 7-phosphate kinase / D-beta-D-heptose 1-phosphate adenosyltransferase
VSGGARLRMVSSPGERSGSEPRQLVVIGDALLDRDVLGEVRRLAPDAPVPVLDETDAGARPGGAALAALLAARDGQRVTLVAALAHDAAAEELRAAIRAEGIELIELELDGATPEKVRFRTGRRSLLRVDRGGSGAAIGPVPATVRAAIGWASAVLVSDYGRGVAELVELRDMLTAAADDVPVVWDPHPRGPAPIPGVAVVTPNESEAARLASDSAGHAAARSDECLGLDAARADALRTQWLADAVCLTRGADGALLTRPGSAPLVLPAERADGGDPCGAGDRFAARLAASLSEGAAVEDAALEAVASASAFVAAGGAGAIQWSRSRGAGQDTAVREPVDGGGELLDGMALAESVRAANGTVVATGGCFDLLHAGHVRTLEAARRLGDCLVVCLNSDASVRRLKGPRRPLVPQADRVAVLAALACVDAVAIFDEDTPCAALEALRPHVWAKGGDYEGAELPEQRTLSAWGGRAVLLPFVDGHSTTRLIEEAACRA